MPQKCIVKLMNKNKTAYYWVERLFTLLQEKVKMNFNSFAI